MPLLAPVKTQSNAPVIPESERAEAIPTQWLNELEVWDALLHDMPLTALVRNLGKMSAVGLVKPAPASIHVRFMAPVG